MANNNTSKCKYKSTSGRTIDGSLVFVDVVVVVAAAVVAVTLANGVGTGVELVVDA